MIQTPTTFILGAGASMPYHFPSGAMLRDWICNNARNHQEEIAKLTNDVELSELRDFARTFHRSGVNSVDSFLMRRTEFSTPGKLAIAANLCVFEEPESMYGVKEAPNWYRYVWNMMIEGSQELEDVRRNTVRFITFNYDRSLEFFLFEACKHTFGVPDSAAFKVVSSVGILHVYGSLGRFHYSGSDPDSRAFDSALTTRTLQIAASNIRLIPEERGDGKPFQLARNWMG